MITSSFYALAYYVLSTILLVFPDSTGLSSEMTTAFSTLGGYLNIFEPVLPMATIASALALVISIELIVFSFKAFRWVWSHVPLIGGRG